MERKAMFVLDPSSRTPIIEAYEDDAANRGERPVLEGLAGWGSASITSRSVPDLFDTRHFRRGKTIAARVIDMTVLLRDNASRSVLTRLERYAGVQRMLDVIRVTYDDNGTRSLKTTVKGYLIESNVVDQLGTDYFRVRLTFQVPSNQAYITDEMDTAPAPEWAQIRQGYHDAISVAYYGTRNTIFQYRFAGETDWRTFSEAEPSTVLSIGIPEQFLGTSITLRIRTSAPWERSPWNQQTIMLTAP